MSGGHFDYKQHQIDESASELFSLIRENILPEKNEYIYPKEILEEFIIGYEYLKKSAIYLQRIDWLVSGDDGEESFKERLEKELEEHEKVVSDLENKLNKIKE